MSRRSGIYSREIKADPVHNNVLLAKFINKIMTDGKKHLAQKIVYGALKIVSDKIKEPELMAFEKSLKNASPLLEVKSRRVGGSTYQVPIEVRPERGRLIAMKWIIILARSKKGRPMVEKLAAELLDAYNRVGAAMKKRDETHKMAEANKAFAHFRW